MKQIQSYYSLIARGDFTIYEMRIFLLMAKRVQPLYIGHKYADFLLRPICTDGVNLNFAVPLSALIGGKSHNYEPLKKAIRHMEKEWHIEFYNTQEKIWSASSVIYNVQIYEREGFMRFSCPKWLIDYIADIRNGGYRIYDFERAMSLRNPNAARWYLITCSLEKTQYYKVSELKQMFGVGDKYKSISDFIRRCIKPAARELENRGFNGFTYESVNSKASKINGIEPMIKISPVKREYKNHEKIENVQINVQNQLPEVMVNYFIYELNFSWIELRNNMKTLLKFSQRLGWDNKLYEIVERARRKNKNHGYIIQGIKKEMQIK